MTIVKHLIVGLLVKLRLRGQILRYAPEPLVEFYKKSGGNFDPTLKGVMMSEANRATRLRGHSAEESLKSSALKGVIG